TGLFAVVFGFKTQPACASDGYQFVRIDQILRGTQGNTVVDCDHWYGVIGLDFVPGTDDGLITTEVVTCQTGRIGGTTYRAVEQGFRINHKRFGVAELVSKCAVRIQMQGQCIGRVVHKLYTATKAVAL